VTEPLQFATGRNIRQAPLSGIDMTILVTLSPWRFADGSRPTGARARCSQRVWRLPTLEIGRAR
jgi:hypothetical protein